MSREIGRRPEQMEDAKTQWEWVFSDSTGRELLKKADELITEMRKNGITQIGEVCVRSYKDEEIARLKSHIRGLKGTIKGLNK